MAKGYKEQSNKDNSWWQICWSL